MRGNVAAVDIIAYSGRAKGPSVREKLIFFFFQAEDGIRFFHVARVQTCALPIWQQFGEDEMNTVRDYRDAIFGIMNALRQVGFNGTEDQRTKALDVLLETRRKLYA